MGDFIRPMWYELDDDVHATGSFYGRWLFDIAFFMIVNMYIINLILALLVDGLGKARDEQNYFFETLENECLVEP